MLKGLRNESDALLSPGLTIVLKSFNWAIFVFLGNRKLPLAVTSLTGGASSSHENRKRDTRKSGHVTIFLLVDTWRLENGPTKTLYCNYIHRTV